MQNRVMMMRFISSSNAGLDTGAKIASYSTNQLLRW
jgi:hypothetical protein